MTAAETPESKPANHDLENAPIFNDVSLLNIFLK